MLVNGANGRFTVAQLPATVIYDAVSSVRLGMLIQLTLDTFMHFAAGFHFHLTLCVKIVITNIIPTEGIKIIKDKFNWLIINTSYNDWYWHFN